MGVLTFEAEKDSCERGVRARVPSCGNERFANELEAEGRDEVGAEFDADEPESGEPRLKLSSSVGGPCGAGPGPFRPESTEVRVEDESEGVSGSSGEPGTIGCRLG